MKSMRIMNKYEAEDCDDHEEDMLKKPPCSNFEQRFIQILSKFVQQYSKLSTSHNR